MHKRLASVAVALCVSGALLQGQTVIPHTVLQAGTGTTTSRVYTGLDAQGTTLTATAGAGGQLLTIPGSPGPSSFPGLHFGGNNTSATYTLTFSAPVTFAEFLFTAHSNTPNGDVETLSNFTSNAGALIGAFTNVQNTAWNGTTLTTSAPDGRATLGFTRAGGGSFSSVSFNFNVLSGSPEGTVIQQMRYSLAGSASAVPEPSTYALTAVGLIAIAVLRRRRA